MSDEDLLLIHKMTQEQRDVLCNPVNGMRVGNKVYHDGEWLDLMKLFYNDISFMGDKKLRKLRMIHPVTLDHVDEWVEDDD